MSKRNKLARMLQAPVRGIKNWIAPKRAQARRAEKARFVVYGRPHQTIDGIGTVRNLDAGTITSDTFAQALARLTDATNEMLGDGPEYDWDPIVEEDPEAWARRVSAAGDIIEEHRVATGRDLSGYEELFAAPMIETKDVSAGQGDVGGDKGSGTLSGAHIYGTHGVMIYIDDVLLNGDGVGRPSGIIPASRERIPVDTGKIYHSIFTDGLTRNRK